MPKDKAPDNMPTVAIQSTVERVKRDLYFWQAVLAEREESVLGARSMIVHYTEQEVKFEVWLEKRLEETL